MYTTSEQLARLRIGGRATKLTHALLAEQLRFRVGYGFHLSFRKVTTVTSGKAEVTSWLWREPLIGRNLLRYTATWVRAGYLQNRHRR